MAVFMDDSFTVQSENVSYSIDTIEALYSYRSSVVEGNTVLLLEKSFEIRTLRHVPKTGLMLVGWGGNNGSTLTAGILANKMNTCWNTKDGQQKANYYGSLTQASTVRLGLNSEGESVYIPFSRMLPMLHPNDLVISGWDISRLNLADSMVRAKVIDYDLQRQLLPHMETLVPLPSIYDPDFIAANQSDRADNIIHGTKQHQLEHIRRDIREFKAANSLDKVIILWTANTERFCDIIDGVNSNSEELLTSINVSLRCFHHAKILVLAFLLFFHFCRSIT